MRDGGKEWGRVLSTYLFEDALIEELLQLLITVVDAELLETVVLEIFWETQRDSESGRDWETHREREDNEVRRERKRVIKWEEKKKKKKGQTIWEKVRERAKAEDMKVEEMKDLTLTLT